MLSWIFGRDHNVVVIRASFFVFLSLLPVPLAAVTPAPSEFAACRRWVEQNLGATQHAYSYRYGGKWNAAAEGIQVKADVRRFEDFPAVEWLVRFRNATPVDSQILEAVRALDAKFDLAASKGATIHWARGGAASFDDFEPETTVIESRKPLHLDSKEGRSSSQVMPFFNVETGGRGVILAIGWSGTWAADFAVDAAGGVGVQAGMMRTHLKLLPGEAIRTPRMLALFYEGDRWRGQNLLRQFILKYHRPQPLGKPLVAPVTNGNWGGTSAEVHLDNIRKIIAHHLPIQYYWIDAEWYGQPGPPDSWSKNTGDWRVKRDLYPNGFKPLSDALRASGRELMLWFEPERVVKGTPWYRDHKEWLLDIGRSSSLLNLGNPDARRFLTDFISARIDEFGLGCYRQDFNIDPLPFWTAADAPDRQGITEIRYIEGLYAYWDELLARHPGLIIDNCASGGRRIDLETIGRATPFWRSDGPRDPIAHQLQTEGLLPWVPLNAISEDRAPVDYDFRSGMSSALCLNWWVAGDKPSERIPDDFPYAWARKTLRQYVDYRKYYYGDFYPLTQYAETRDVWMAYQLDRPDLGAGMVVALKRPDSPYETAHFRLRGLDPAARYRVESLDTKSAVVYTGTELAERGLPLVLTRNPDSAVLLYKRLGTASGQ